MFFKQVFFENTLFCFIQNKNNCSIHSWVVWYFPGQPSHPPFFVGRVLPSLEFVFFSSVRPSCFYDGLVEKSVTTFQRTMEDVQVGECACDVKKDIKILFSEAPFHLEGRLQQLSLLKKHSTKTLCPKFWFQTIANDKSMDVTVCAHVAKIRKEGPTTKETFDGLSVVSDDHNVMDTALVNF